MRKRKNRNEPDVFVGNGKEPPKSPPPRGQKHPPTPPPLETEPSEAAPITMDPNYDEFALVEPSEQLVELFEQFFANIHTASWGESFSIMKEERHVTAIWLAKEVTKAGVMAGRKVVVQ